MKKRTHQTTPLIFDIYKMLFAHYGEQHWWPSKSGEPWEIVAGAVLTQNCAWRNVEKALDNLSGLGVSTPHQLLALPPATLQAAIRPAGFFTQKSVYLREAARFFIAHEAEFSRPCPAEELRARRMRLLGVKGVGRETADSILLYAFKQPVFVIDAYTRRFAERHLAVPHAATLPYDALQAVFTGNLPQDVRIYNEYHALIVRLCKDTCRKQSCACPFAPCNAEGGHV